MTPVVRQSIWLTAGAAALFALLRSLPDSHCAFLHADHQPLLVEGVEFCGENEEANFYDPVSLGFPFSLKVTPRDDLSGGSLRILDEDGHDVPPHLLAISHTRQLHLHLRQVTGGRSYLHVHPVPQPDGSWAFDLPRPFAAAFAGGRFEAYADFLHARSRRTILLSATTEWPAKHANFEPGQCELYRGMSAALHASARLRAGSSVTLHVRLVRADGQPVLLRPLMGALGHAVLVSEDGRPGYAHMHPSWTGREKGDSPELAFRLRLPAAGKYILWVHVDDAGVERYAPVALVVSE